MGGFRRSRVNRLVVPTPMGDRVMTKASWTPLTLFCLALVPGTGLAQGGPTDGLLPPPVRQAEKRPLTGNPNINYNDGRQITGAAFSPDGKLLLTASGSQAAR